jgi:hypothetical protein
MPPHIDSYSYEVDPFDLSQSSWQEPSRLFEGKQAVDYGKLRDLPRRLGYVYLTAVHEDQECEQHHPPEPPFAAWEDVGEGYILPPIPKD